MSNVAAEAGLEPATVRLTAARSTIELLGRDRPSPVNLLKLLDQVLNYGQNHVLANFRRDGGVQIYRDVHVPALIEMDCDMG